MSKTLTETSLETQYGRPIFEDIETGEKHSELSATFEYKGKWVNMPTLHKGKIYTVEQLKRFLDLEDSALDGWITSTHKSKFDAEQAAQYRSNNMEQTAAKTNNSNFLLNNASMALISADPGYINRDAIKLKNDKILAEKRNKRLAAKVQPIFTYKGDRQKEKEIKIKKPIVLEKNLKIDYGEMPGFKQPLDAKGKKQGYYDADEKSEFWQTDAGYEKAMQTWGRNGGVLPQFVKKPKQKELNMSAIKQFFTSSNR